MDAGSEVGEVRNSSDTRLSGRESIRSSKKMQERGSRWVQEAGHRDARKSSQGRAEVQKEGLP